MTKVLLTNYLTCGLHGSRDAEHFVYNFHGIVVHAFGVCHDGALHFLQNIRSSFLCMRIIQFEYKSK